MPCQECDRSATFHLGRFGNLGGPGSVSYMFHRKGQITVPLAASPEDSVLEVVLEAGAEEMDHDDEHHVITTPPDQLYAVADALKKAAIEPDSQKLTYIPQNSVTVADEQTATQVLRLYDALDDCDDVLNVHANFDIPETILSKIQHN